MCPSYRVTREERHSTRGRARLLYEMLNGELIEDGWRSDAVHDALDLCLSCKGCKSDCPVNVDMATYKAEFLSHYYANRLRPRHAYAFGWVRSWVRLAGRAPMLARFATQMPGVRSLAKHAAGVDPRRRIPAVAPQTFKAWFRTHAARHPDGPLVVLFADTFNDHFHPETATAAVEVLEDAGFRVAVPMQDICCGRPLYEYGFLGMARRRLQRVIRALLPVIRADVPIVVLEPSCWSVFKDELTNLLPNDRDAQKLQANVHLFGEFLRTHAAQYRLPQTRRKALVHGHCHHKALDRLDDKVYGDLFNEKALLDDMKIDYRMPDSGCCGMAGGFGFESGEHYDVAVSCGERTLIPEVAAAPDSTLIVADGFSCREQIAQLTDRRALHIAQVVQLAIRERDGQAVQDGARPEAPIERARAKAVRSAAVRSTSMLALGALAVGLTYAATHRRARSEPAQQTDRGGRT